MVKILICVMSSFGVAARAVLAAARERMRVKSARWMAEKGHSIFVLSSKWMARQ